MKRQLPFKIGSSGHIHRQTCQAQSERGLSRNGGKAILCPVSPAGCCTACKNVCKYYCHKEVENFGSKEDCVLISVPCTDNQNGSRDVIIEVYGASLYFGAYSIVETSSY